MYLILRYGEQKRSAMLLLAAACVLAYTTSALLLPGIALRYPVYSALRESIGASDRIITLLFAASTPIVIASRVKTIMV
jgi:hypothetical protein